MGTVFRKELMHTDQILKVDLVKINTVKLLNSGHLQVLKNLFVIKRFPLLRGSLTKIVTFGTKHFVRYSRHVRYLGCPLLGDFTVYEVLRDLTGFSSLHQPALTVGLLKPANQNFKIYEWYQIRISIWVTFFIK